MLNDKALIQVCLMAKQTEVKILQDLEEIRKDLLMNLSTELYNLQSN